LQTEAHWPTLERILEFLSGTIEHRFLVYTAGVQNVNKLVHAVLGVVSRIEERYPLLPKAKLARYLCPVLGKLVNYTPAHDNQIWYVLNLFFINHYAILAKSLSIWSGVAVRKQSWVSFCEILIYPNFSR
jgi:hypothetical protein